MGKLDFSIAINLLTENFKKGANEVKNAFSSMQAKLVTFAAAMQMGDLSIGGFFSGMIDIARKANEATISLKNVSSSTQQYIEDQKFLIELAKQYGIEINGLTLQYARFTAAANIEGMAVKQQHDIFASVSRAVAAFSLSSENAQRVFMALERMVSTNVINSKELRMEMGMQLPVAIQAMAMATGKSVEEMMKMMKAGKLLAKDVLPKFADALNKLIPNVDTNHLETSINRLKNAETEFTNKAGVQDTYKSLLDWLTGAVEYAGNNIKSITTSVVAFLIGASIGKFFKWFSNQLAVAQRDAMFAAKRTAREAGVQFDAVKWKAESGAATIGAAFKRAGNVIKSAFISILPTFIFIALSEIIGKLIEAAQETKRIKGLWSDYQKGLYAASHTTEIEQLKIIQDQYNKANGNTKVQVKLIDKINSLMGTHLTKENNINTAISQRINLLEKAAKAEYYINKKVQADDASNDITNKYGGAKNYNYLVSMFNSKIKSGSLKDMDNTLGRWARSGQTIKGLDGKSYSLNDIYKDKSEFNQQRRISYDSHKNAYENTNINNVPGGDDAKKKKKETELEKAYDKYISDLKKLGEQLKQGDINQADYNVSVDKLNKETLTNLAGLKQKGIKNSPFYLDLKSKTSDKGLIAQHELDKVESDYSDKVDEAKTAASKGAITQNELSDKLASLANDAAMQALSIKNIGNAADSFVKKVKGDIAGIELSKVQSDYADKLDEQKSLLATGQISMEAFNNAMAEASKDAAETAAKIKNIGNQANPFIKEMKTNQQKATVKPRDTTFDYSKTQYDIASEKYDQHIEQLKVQFGELSEQVRIATTNADDFKQAMNLAKINADIKDYRKQLGLMGGNFKQFETIKDGVEGIYNAWDNLKDSFRENPFKGLLSALDAFTTTVDTIDNTISALEEVSKVMTALSGAQKAKEAITVSTEAASTTAVTTGATAHVAAKAAEVAANEAAQVSAQGLMAAESAAAYAAIPFVGASLAAAQIASMMAMISAAQIPMFANGGIVGGDSYTGDKVIARVNSGEMILNKNQQSNLFKMLNGGNTNGVANINIGIDKVRGSDIYLSLKNYMRSTSKKL